VVKDPTGESKSAIHDTWMFGIARTTNDQAWLNGLSQQLLEAQKRVVWGLPASYFVGTSLLLPPNGVVTYPYADLPDDPAEVVRSRKPAMHNVDGPCPYADRTRHLWESFALDGSDTFVVPNGRLDDLEALWSVYALCNISSAPTTIFRLSELVAPDAAEEYSKGELNERLEWIAYRLKVLDLPNTKVLIWPGSQLIATLLDRANLPRTELQPLASNAPGRGALLAVTTIAEDEVLLAESLTKACGGRSTDVTSFDDQSSLVSQSINFHGPDRLPKGFYDRLVIAPELLGAVARADVDCASNRILILGDKTEEGPDLFHAFPGSEGPPPVPESRALALALLDLVEQSRERECWPKPIVLHIAPAWSVAGSTHVFQCQLDWLRERGYPVACIHLDTDEWEAGAYDDRLVRLPGDRALIRWMLSRPEEERAFERARNIPGPYENISLEGEERIARQVCVPDSLINFLRRRAIRFVVLNYGHNWPLIERLGLSDLPVILEAHDVRPIQHALYSNTKVIEAAIEVEQSRFARAQRVVFINEKERTDFQARYPDVPSVSAFPTRDALLPQIPGSYRFETKATSLLSMSGLPADILLELFVPRELRKRRFVVFVGSSHAANVMSLKWFLLNAYPHGLADESIVFLVAGRVREAYGDAYLPNVYFCGQISDLGMLYELADLTILPVIAGTGLPIKTLDALTCGAPFVATSGATSAIPGLGQVAGTYEDGRAFAARVRELAFDDTARDAFVSAITEFKARQANWAVYTTVWDGLLNSLKIDDSSNLMPPAARIPVHARESAAGRRKGRFYFWPGHGLEEMVGLARTDDGFVLNSAYSRIGLTCAAYPSQNDNSSSRRLELTARISATEETRIHMVVQGRDRVWLDLHPDQPQFITILCHTLAAGTIHRVSLEFRLDPDGEREAGAVALRQLSANWC